MAHQCDDVCCLVALVVEDNYFPYYSYRRDSAGRDLFVPAQTLIVVKLLMAIIDDYLVGVELYLEFNIYLWPQPSFSGRLV